MGTTFYQVNTMELGSIVENIYNINKSKDRFEYNGMAGVNEITKFLNHS